MFRCRSWALLLRQQCRGVPHGLCDSRRTIAIPAARPSFSRSVYQGLTVQSVHAYFPSNNRRSRALSTVTYGARDRSTPTETPRLVRLLHDPPSDTSERQGVHAENGLFSPRPDMPGQDEPLGKQKLSGEEDLPGDDLVRRLHSKGRSYLIDLRHRRHRRHCRQSNSGLIRRIKQGSIRRIKTSDHPLNSELHSTEIYAPEYRLWPENLWRPDRNDNQDQQDTKEINNTDSQPSHVTTTPERLGNSFEPVLRTPAKAFYPANLAQETEFPRLENILFRFFTRLESLVDQKAPGEQILQLFETISWLDAKIASTFGEEELDMLGRALDVVAHDEFAQPMNFTIMGVKSTRFQTPKCLAMYQRWGLCRPCHWAAVLMEAAAGLSNFKRLTPPNDLEEKFMSDIVMYSKTSSFLTLWRRFLVEYHSPLIETTASARSSVNYGIHDTGRKSFQESVFNQLTTWPRGDDPVVDEKINGAFILTIAFCSDIVTSTASQHLPTPTLNAGLSEEAIQSHGTTSASENEMAYDICEQDSGKWDLPQVMARAIAPATLNTTWARLLLAKHSTPGEQARAVLSDVAQIRDATRHGVALRPLQDALLAPSTDAVIAWLKTSGVDESRAFGAWLVQGDYRIHWILPGVMRQRLYHALFASYVRLGLLAEARELLKRGGSLVFGRGACSTLLRAFYRNGNDLEFCTFWAKFMKPASRKAWGPVPRFWRYYRLRFLWKQRPHLAFEFLFVMCRNGDLSKHAYTRLRASLISMASRDIQQRIGADVEVADANLVLSPKGTNAMGDVCIMALRHAICTGQIRSARLWLGTYRQHLNKADDDDELLELLDSARRLVFHCGLVARRDLDWRDIAGLFMAAISFRFSSLDGPILNVLTQDTTATAKAEQSQLDSLMMAVAKTNRLFEEAVLRSQRSDKMQILNAFREFLLLLPLKDCSNERATNAVSRMIDTLTKLDVKKLAPYRTTKSEPQLERQHKAQLEPGKSSKRGPQPRKDVVPHALERKRGLQKKETTATATMTPQLDRYPPTPNLFREHLATSWIDQIGPRYRPASARWVGEPEEPNHDTDDGLREAQLEPVKSSKRHSQPSDDVKKYNLEGKEGLPKNKKTTTPRLGRRLLTKRPRASRRPWLRNRKHKVEGLITVGRLKSLLTKPVKSRQDPLNPPKPNEDAHFAGSEVAPGPPPPLRIWKHKTWDPSTADRPKFHNLRRHNKAWRNKRWHNKALKAKLRR